MASIKVPRPKKAKFSRPPGAGNFDNMDDFNFVQSINSAQGTIDHTPTQNKDIVNKEYVDSETDKCLKLDCSNDPLTAPLEIEGTSNQLTLTNTTDDKSMSISVDSLGDAYFTNVGGDFSFTGTMNLSGTFTGQDDIRIDADSKKLYLGEGQDASIYYDGTDLIVNPKDTGSGIVKFNNCEVSCSQNVTDSETLGNGATVLGTKSTIIGNDAKEKASNGGKNTILGHNSSIDVDNAAYGYRNTILGYNNTINSTSYEWDNILIGGDITVSGSNNTNNIIIGTNVTYTGYGAFVIGNGCTSNGNSNTNLGHSTVCQNGGTAAGYQARAGDYFAISIGYQANNASGAGNRRSIVIGSSVNSTANFQGLFGGTANSRVDNMFIGQGVTYSAPTTSVYIHTTGGSGTNINASDMILCAGKSTGNATPGYLSFQTSTAGASGTTLQTLSERMRIDSSQITANLCIKPASMADGSAPNDSIYYSTTASKLVYKDSGGGVNNLY